MGDVVSIADAAAGLAALGGEVTATAGPRGAFAGPVPHTLRFAGEEGDEVKIYYRGIEGRTETIAVLYGATTLKVIQALCRRLGRAADQLIAVDGRHIKDPFGGDPDPFAMAYIHAAIGDKADKPGEALAFLKGVSPVMLNVVLKKPVRGPRLSAPKPAPATPMAATTQPVAPTPTPAWMNDPHDERAWLEGGAYLPTPHGDPLSGDDE